MKNAKYIKKYIYVTIVITVIFSVSVVFLNFRMFCMSKTIEDLQKEIIAKDTTPKKEIETITIPEPLNKNKVGTYSLEKLKNLDLTGYDKIMISTHPDDEMFWGGGHLLEDDYLVVCVTCGMDDNRLAEFKKAMTATNDKYITLTYPRVVDPSLKREFNWEATSYLTQDLINILNLKDWDMIVTHNPDGEYGHKYHKLTSQVVTSIVKDKDKLYYFEKYYKKDAAATYDGPVLKNDIYERKHKIIDETYLSQWGSVRDHKHMFNNENFVKYSDWNKA